MKTTYDASKIKEINGARIAIVQASWHKEHLEKMTGICSEILRKAGAEVEIFVVPGTYEIPLAAKLLARQQRYDAIAVFGIIHKGQTDHYEIILQTVIRELGKVMYDFEVPIIMEILPVHNIQHAIDRASGKGNKGIEAAQAAIDIIRVRKEIEALIKVEKVGNF